jgi:hypothetical protein
VTGYRVFLGASSKTYGQTVQLGSVAPASDGIARATLSLDDTRTYYVAMAAYNGYGQSPNSNEIAVRPPSYAGLVAAYGFGEGSGSLVLDSSGRANTGTIVGAIRTTAGKFGSALLFNGTNSLVRIPHTASLNLTSGMTLEAWVYPISSGGWRDLIYKSLGSLSLYYLGTYSGLSATGGTYGAHIYGRGTLPLNAWSHVAATYDRTTQRIYVNGVQVGSRAETDLIQTSTEAVTLGGDTAHARYWAGRIDEVRIYNRALSASEIQRDLANAVR